MENQQTTVISNSSEIPLLKKEESEKEISPTLKKQPSNPLPKLKDTHPKEEKRDSYIGQVITTPENKNEPSEENLTEKECEQILDEAVKIAKNTQTTLPTTTPTPYRMSVSVITFYNDEDNGYFSSSRNDKGIYSSSSKLSLDKAFTSLSFSDNNRSIRSGDVLEYFSGVSSNSGNESFDFTTSKGGVPIYKNEKLVGAIGISGYSENIDEEISIKSIQNLGFSHSSKLFEKRPEEPRISIFTISDQESVITNNKTGKCYIVKTINQSPICGHIFPTLERYFNERSTSRVPQFVCPRCSK